MGETRAVQIINGFITAHCFAQTQIASFFGMDEQVDTPEEAFVIVESQIEVFKAASLQSRIDRKVRVKVNTMWETSRLYRQYYNFVTSVHRSGVLQAKEVEMLVHPISDIIHNHEKSRKSQVHGGETPKVMCELDAIIRIQTWWRHRSARSVMRKIASEPCTSPTDTPLLRL